MEEPNAIAVFLNWLPMILYLGFWAYFIHRYGVNHREIMNAQANIAAQSQRQAEAMERIANELAKRNASES